MTSTIASPRVWAAIDAHAPSPVIDTTMTVGGLPLVTRLVRQLARLGYAGARVLCRDDDAAHRVRRTLDRAPGPGSFPVEVIAAAEPGPVAVTLDGCALYSSEALAAARVGARPAPYFTVRTAADRAEGVRRLFRALGKDRARDGLFTYYVARPVARIVARALLATSVTPNQVTLAALACGLVAAVLLGGGGARASAGAGALLLLGALLDNVDGDLARLRLQFSRTGEWLDAVSDEVVTLAITAALGLGLVRDGAPPAWQTAALATVATDAVVLLRLYLELARLGGPIDTAIYPWFFRTADRPSRRSRLGGALAALVDVVARRDVYITAIAILLITDHRQAALLGLLAGVTGLVVTYATHWLVTATRRR
ncbi:MAG: CDP-alcohol phosphatidyltransferase family protein [Kofleriaceae bacterium]|jgi:phosphatidylglycerophosphate synthase|nr:CDP-alcohol phosphatidyltransferase family protein [Kofleriaceae bacterium]MBP9171331.1 CDP-alcohol phosphatidyltransferase family protein [Kofleriaceae bacterium]MBP9860822.1 CDP-alcohol phosphatidyltransferase family protein [Kofleriaceae bacterium]